MNKKINVSTIITYIFCAVAIFIAFFTAFKLLNSNNDEQEKQTNSFFGYNFFVVLSGSMEKEFPVGSLIISKDVDVETLEVGDIISFVSIDPNYEDEVVSHKIRSITEHEGELAFETYGTTTGVSDSLPALSSKILGKYQSTIPYIGNAIVFIQGENGFLIFIILPLSILFILQVIKLVKRLRNIEVLDEEVENNDDKEENKTLRYSKKNNKTSKIKAQKRKTIKQDKAKYSAKRYRI